MKKIISLLSVFAIGFLIVGCGAKSIEMVTLENSTLEERQLQTRYYETDKYLEVFSAGLSVMQDLGFNIDEINKELGVITASKTRDATNTAQQVAAIVGLLFAGMYNPHGVNHIQKIHATLVVVPKKDEKRVYTRLTMMRVVISQAGSATELSTIKDVKVYQDFFDKLSKAVFLEGNKI